MQVSYIKCDICYNETTDFEKFYVETRKSERVCDQYDICKDCEKRIEELIQQIRDEERKFTILGGKNEI